MHTQSYLATTPSNHADIGEFSQVDADALTLEDFEGMSYREQAEFHRLFPNAYAHMIEMQEQARNGKPTTYYGMDTPHKGQETPQNISAEEWSKRIDDAIDRVMHRN